MTPILCECGCGEQTGIADRPCKRRGLKTGDHYRFKIGHWARVDTPARAASAKKMIEHNRAHKPTPAEKFLSKIDINDENDCITWTGSLASMGYGRLCINYKEVLAHRWIYEYAVGPIPAGMQIDHICMNRACVNPSHLRIVTPRDNKVFNSNSAAARNLIKTHCPKGHEYNGSNTILKRKPYGIGRDCKVCDRARKREAYRQQRAITRGGVPA